MKKNCLICQLLTLELVLLNINEFKDEENVKKVRKGPELFHPKGKRIAWVHTSSITSKAF